MSIVLGGANARFQRVIGPFCIAYQYVNDEPAMAIWLKAHQRGTPFIICMSAAWKYADSKTGQPTPYCMEQAQIALGKMGGFVTIFDIRRLMDVIVEGLPDLLRLKPSPDEMGEQLEKPAPAIGEMTLKIEGETVAGGDVTAPKASELDHYRDAAQ